MNATAMLASHPNEPKNIEGIAELVARAFECAETCTACADACLAEKQIDMLRRCIRTDLDCADICDTTGRVLSRQTEADDEVARAQIEACRTICRVCAEECEKHASRHEHCRICAESCRECEAACERVLGVGERASG